MTPSPSGNGSIRGGLIPFVVIVAAIVAVIGSIILTFTKFGRYTLAIGCNQEGARRAGINVDRHLIKVYALSGTLAGFANVSSYSRGINGIMVDLAGGEPVRPVSGPRSARSCRGSRTPRSCAWRSRR